MGWHASAPGQVAGLPDRPHRIAAENVVAGDQVQVFDQGLGNEHPVERVAMDRGRAGQGGDVALLDRQDSEASLLRQFEQEALRGPGSLRRRPGALIMISR